MPFKKVLIISHTFPPSPGIGGRRWAKFAKYLDRLGVEVFILKEQRKIGKNQSPWTDDIKELNPSQIFTYKTNYPNILQKKNLNFWDKVYYKLTLMLLSLLCKGNPLDKTAFIKNRFIKQLDKIVSDNNINNIIVSGAPFNLLYYCALYKESNPHINLICDFRDGWSWDGRYGMNLLSEEKISVEKEKEALSVLISDTVLVSSSAHFSALNFHHPYNAHKIKMLSHGFDKDELSGINKNSNKEDFLIYGGTLYNHLEEVFKSLNRSFKAPDSNPLPIHLYLSNPEKLSYYLNLIEPEFHKFFVLKPQVSPKNFYAEVAKAKAFLYWGGIEIKISSKVYEVLFCETPIIVFGVSGELSDFVLKNKLGSFFSPNDFSFNQLLRQLDNVDMSKIEDKIIDYEKVTKDLQSVLK